MATSIRSQVSVVLVARVVGAGLQAVTGLLLARAIAPTVYGVVAAVAGALVFVAVLADFGTSSTIGKYRARQQNLWVRTSLTADGVLLLLAATVSAVFIALLPFTSGLGLVWLLPVGTMLDRHVDAGLAVLFADAERTAPAVSILLRRIVTGVVFLPLMALGVGPVSAYCIAMAIGPAIGWLHMYRRLRQIGLGVPTVQSLRSVMRESFSFAVNDIGVQARSLDATVIASIATPVSAGLFAAATRLTSPFHLLSGTFASVILPRAAGMDRQRVFPLGRRMFWAASIATIGLVPSFLVTTPFLTLLLGPQYGGAGPTLALLLVGLPLAVVIAPLSALLQAVDAATAVARGSIMYSVLVLVGVAIGASIAGAVGAALLAAVLSAVRAAVLLGQLRAHARG